MKQASLFIDDQRLAAPETIYSKTTAKNLIYEPSKRKPHLVELVDRNKTLELELAIEKSNASQPEKEFLIMAAQRHNGFNFDLIADYYSHASPQVQRLMEESGLVIVDFNKAVELGFVRMSEDITAHYTSEHP
jgi:hypothetical protein